MITLEEARAILSPFLERIESCIASAIEEYNKMDAQTRSKFKKRTKANIINDFMAFNAATELEGLPGLLFSRRHQTFSVFIGDSFQLRFKKLDYRLRPSNIPTRRIVQLMNQTQAQLPDMPSPVTHVIAGYVWNDLQTAIKDVYIICPRGQYNEWELRIAAVKSPEVSSAGEISEASNPPSRRVYPKEKTNDLDK